MTTTTTSAALVPAGPVFSEPERLALAGFLAGYSGLTREAYALDLRQFAAWCARHQMQLFGVRRADIECFGRDLEAAGRARATVTRRLCTIAGFYKYAVEEELLDHSPAVHVRWPRLDYESHATGLDRNEVGALLVAAGLGAPGEHALISLLALNGLRSPRPPAPTSRRSAPNAATARWPSPARAASAPSSRSRRGPPGRSTSRSASAAKDPSSLPSPASGWTGTPPGGSSAASPAEQGSPRKSGRTPSDTPSSPPPSTPASRCATSRKRPPTPTREPRSATTGPGSR